MQSVDPDRLVVERFQRWCSGYYPSTSTVAREVVVESATDLPALLQSALVDAASTVFAPSEQRTEPGGPTVVHGTRRHAHTPGTVSLGVAASVGETSSVGVASSVGDSLGVSSGCAVSDGDSEPGDAPVSSPCASLEVSGGSAVMAVSRTEGGSGLSSLMSCQIFSASSVQKTLPRNSESDG